MSFFKSLVGGSLQIATVLFATITLSPPVLAQETLFVYGPGGPAAVMKEAAIAFEKTSGVKVEVTAGPPKWLDQAKANAGLFLAGTRRACFPAAQGRKAMQVNPKLK